MSGRFSLVCGDGVAWLDTLPAESVQLFIVDPPYFQVLEGEAWDNQWNSEAEYLDWMDAWMGKAMRALKEDGLLYLFGQPGKRESAFLRVMARSLTHGKFHDLVIWDRVVGYHVRRDSFTPAYEMILVLKKGASPYFDKNVVREPIPEEVRALYARDKRYKDREARMRHLEAGKYATNLWRIPSLKGSSREKAGHPAQKPLALLDRIVSSSSRPGDLVADPFAGSGSSGVSALRLGRAWMGCECDSRWIAVARERLAGTGGDLFLRED